METLLIVDAANVVGSVPDGWWRDRVAATARLRDRLARIEADGLPDAPVPVEVVLVVEGKVRGLSSIPGVRVADAHGTGDDAIVDLVHDERGARTCVVVTADRALRDRVTALGASVLGPRTIR